MSEPNAISTEPFKSNSKAALYPPPNAWYSNELSSACFNATISSPSTVTKPRSTRVPIGRMNPDEPVMLVNATLFPTASSIDE